ncbi:MAG: hypothetical protein RLZZ127_134 [Planctomycetota bacterium]|jgi:hypothetical protein
MNHARSRATRGNALVLTLGVAVVVAGLVLATTESGIASMRDAKRQSGHPEAVAALEAVLRRREAMVAEAAAQGGPGLVRRFDPRFADPAVFLGESNYGVDFIGRVQVRWAIEPVATRQQDGGGTEIPWIQNPPPDPAAAPPLLANERDNPVVYAFRISGEARIYAPDGASMEVQIQGARYAAVNMEPLFRYVIFYAKEGPAGDLELSHADPVQIKVSVHSNGSVYLGGGLRVNDAIARLGPLTSGLAPSTTTIGPDGASRAVAVTAADGVFRLNKGLMYAIVNQFPITTDVSAAAMSGPPGVSWAKADAVDLSVVPPATSHYPEGTPDSIDNVTVGGTLISPWRIRTISGAVTVGAQGSGSGLAWNPIDARQTINAVAIRGVDQDATVNIANDSRQDEWPTLSGQASAPGFGGRVKDIRTGGRVIRLPPLMRNRAFEPQQIENLDQPGEHQRPLFVSGIGSTTTVPTADPAIEAAGQYLRYALGQSDIHFARRATGSGWFASTSGGADTANTQLASAAGLIIRERAIPDTALWPGTGQVGTLVPEGHPRYLPYAYGKQWYPTTFPFTAADLSDAIHQRMRGSTSYPGSAWLNHGTSGSMRRQQYNGLQGSITITAANAPGPRRNDDTGTTSSVGFQNWGTQWRWSTTAPTTDPTRAALYVAAGGDPSPRKPYFYNENWRFVHLKAATAAAVAGWKATQFNDQNRPTPTTAYTLGSNETYHSLLGQPSATTTVAVATPTTAHGVLADFSAATWRSYRWEAMLVPARSATYAFGFLAGTVPARVFVDGDLVYDGWWGSITPGLNAPLVTSKTLVAGATVAVVVEAYRGSGAFPSLTLQWRAGHWSGPATIPTAPFGFSSDAGQMYRRSEGVAFDRSRFQAVQALIRNTTPSSAAPAAKYGLMLRDGGGGLSPLMSGSDRYLMIGWSPARGVFTQRRLERSFQTEHTLGNQFYIGSGSGPSGTADAAGIVYDNSLSVSTVSRGATLGQIALGSVVIGGVSYPTNTVNGSITWTPSTSTVTVPDLNLGGGVTWTFTGSISRGTWQGSRTQYIQKRQSQTLYQLATYQLYGYNGGFVDADRTAARVLRIFNAATGTATYNTGNVDSDAFDTSNAYLTAGTTPPNADRWYVYGTLGASGWTQLRRRYQYTRTGAWVNGTTVTQTSNTVGGANVLWYTGSAPVITKIGVPGTATVADINTMTGGAFTQLLPAPTISTPGGLTWSPSAAAPADGAAPAITDTAVPTIPVFPRTFQVQRAGSTVQFQLNAFITRLGTWFAPAVEQYAPWNATWGAITTAVAETGGFRPDFWRGPAAPTVAVTTSEANTGGTTWQNGTQPWRMGDDIATPGVSQCWLRIERASGGTFALKYYTGSLSDPAPSDFITAVSGITLPASWSNELLLGPCLQSGDANIAATAEFANLRVETTEAADGVIDKDDWNASTVADAMDRYLASQYQVFMGGTEITEDFFTWRPSSSATAGIASEDWFYQPREFWSQSRFWEHTAAAAPATPIAKDSGNFTDTTVRSLLAKTTVLTLDLGLVQDYLRTRTITEATRRPLSNPAAAATITSSDTLRSRFNGLLYAHRSNRYAWNPSTDPDLGTPAAANGFNPSASLPLPNGNVNAAESVANGQPLHGWTHPALYHMGVHKLQPYALAQAPAFKPQHFHHGIRIRNAANVDWAYADKGTQTGNQVVHATAPAFGATKLSIVTPNHLYLQGDVNTVEHVVSSNSSDADKFAPMAVMGDVITVLSNQWDRDPATGEYVGDLKYQIDGLTVTNVAGASSVTGAGALACQTQGSTATSTTINAALVTHNIPTGKTRVAEGQAAPFVDALQFIENWNGATLTYRGSLVVMDTRRYTDAFLLDAPKKYGRTPFGTTAPTPAWVTVHGPADWSGQTPVIYAEPLRVYQFNDDFLTAEGTPPFTPFGMTLDGIGSWTEIIR